MRDDQICSIATFIMNWQSTAPDRRAAIPTLSGPPVGTDTTKQRRLATPPGARPWLLHRVSGLSRGHHHRPGLDGFRGHARHWHTPPSVPPARLHRDSHLAGAVPVRIDRCSRCTSGRRLPADHAQDLQQIHDRSGHGGLDRLPDVPGKFSTRIKIGVIVGGFAAQSQSFNPRPARIPASPSPGRAGRSGLIPPYEDKGQHQQPG